MEAFLNMEVIYRSCLMSLMYRRYCEKSEDDEMATLKRTEIAMI